MGITSIIVQGLTSMILGVPNPWDMQVRKLVATIRLTLLYAKALHNIYVGLPDVQLKTVDKAIELWYNLTNLCSIID